MGWLGDLFGGAAGGAVKGTLEGAGSFARDVRAAITGEIDPAKLAELQQQAAELESKSQLAQAEINKAEAKHSNLFVAGWRPGLGWCGTLAIFYQFIFRPLMLGFTDLDMPEINADALWPIIAGMLGLGAYRTVEKARGVQDRH
jgi:hypothetical protein